MVEPFVQMSGVRKTMQRQVVIDDLHLQAGSGEIVALCGGNGAGKSTILRMLAGVLQPDQGEIRVGVLDWRQDRLGYAAQIGYMPDDYRFSPGLTAAETMRFWARLRGLPPARAMEVLADVGLTETGRKPVSAFSKGMRQRILFAQALLSRPPLLIMDEPTNGLDPYWMESFAALVRQAAAAGQTVIFSTHQLPLAEGLADRIAFLRGGVIELEGPAAEIRARLGADGLQEAFASLFGFPVHRAE
ncbi:ABC transporter ATP-binding protein [Paenibacillus sp. 1P07SE]|uniref:ABC transporter ATP-binding protein n=1 Tax=Paenibacillus sp. 1P07SE TaxID=3132209 RepID=UPI0039A5127C